ncbi:probable methyltransferase BMT2 homolog [Anoplophora glabripennis]|uniref:probable methyltransferase BMT2 homolog n=1 Tax=Anoplophora glabripennis TaxID=217634 RepID=UPI0008759F0B|nr:probable methyltransferase BMT2 homolog [Anoplophora glabripennis]
MASAGHLELSDFIKSVHQNLREASKRIGSEHAWQNHCSDEENLKKYAHSMQELACQYWEKNIESNTKSRIKWTVDSCMNYFTNEISKFRNKEKDISLKINCELAESDSYELQKTTKLKLLDVGSCYNPFNKFEVFEVTAIDIAPAVDGVYKSDFLNVKVGDTLAPNNNGFDELPRNYFDIVVFSLLLEYLPSPKQRLLCCEKAYEILKNEGLLIVITPDSNHVGANAKYMKSWRYVLAKIGFSRIKYEKLPHVHCMAFRKAISKAVASRWAELHENEELFEEIYIPQDFNNSNKERTNNCEVGSDRTQSIFVDFAELPECDIF